MKKGSTMKSWREASPMAIAAVGAEIDGLAAKLAYCIDMYRWARVKGGATLSVALATLELYGVRNIAIDQHRTDGDLLHGLGTQLHLMVWGANGEMTNLETTGVRLEFSDRINAILDDIRKLAEG